MPQICVKIVMVQLLSSKLKFQKIPEAKNESRPTDLKSPLKSIDLSLVL